MSTNRKQENVRAYSGTASGVWSILAIQAIEILLEEVQENEKDFFNGFNTSMREFLVKGEIDTSKFPVSRQNQIQAPIDVKLNKISDATNQGDKYTKHRSDHDLKDNLSDDDAKVRFLGIRNAIDECRKLQEVYSNAISTKILHIEEKYHDTEKTREGLEHLLKSLNNSTAKLFAYIQSLERLKMALPDNSPEQKYVAQLEQDVKDIYIKAHENILKLYKNPNVHPEHKEEIIKAQEKIEKEDLESRITKYSKDIVALKADVSKCVKELKTVKDTFSRESDVFEKDNLETTQISLLKQLIEYEYRLENMRVTGLQIAALRHFYDGFLDEKIMQDKIKTFMKANEYANLKTDFDKYKTDFSNDFDKFQKQLGISSGMTIIKSSVPAAIVVSDAKTERRDRESAQRQAQVANELKSRETARNMARTAGEYALQSRRETTVNDSHFTRQPAVKHAVVTKLDNVRNTCGTKMREIQKQLAALQVTITDLESKTKTQSMLAANDKTKKELDKLLKKYLSCLSKIGISRNKVNELEKTGSNKKPVDLLKEQRKIISELLKHDDLKKIAPEVLMAIKSIDKEMRKEIDKMSPSLLARLFGGKEEKAMEAGRTVQGQVPANDKKIR